MQHRNIVLRGLSSATSHLAPVSAATSWARSGNGRIASWSWRAHGLAAWRKSVVALAALPMRNVSHRIVPDWKYPWIRVLAKQFGDHTAAEYSSLHQLHPPLGQITERIRSC